MAEAWETFVDFGSPVGPLTHCFARRRPAVEIPATRDAASRQQTSDPVDVQAALPWRKVELGCSAVGVGVVDMVHSDQHGL